jgi:hypothetical protein
MSTVQEQTDQAKARLQDQLNGMAEPQPCDLVLMAGELAVFLANQAYEDGDIIECNRYLRMAQAIEDSGLVDRLVETP